MRVTKDLLIAGYPATQVRACLRASYEYRIERVMDFFNASKKRAEKFVKDMVSLGYWEPNKEVSKPGKKDAQWKPTIKGNALRMASAALPLSRATADRKIEELIKRIQELETNEMAYRVAAVMAFGSYITNAKTLNDIDLILICEPKDDDPEKFKKREEERREYAYMSGRSFNNIFDKICYPEHEITRYLNNRSRAYGFHDLDTISALNTPYTHIYTAPGIDQEQFKLLVDLSVNLKKLSIPNIPILGWGNIYLRNKIVIDPEMSTLLKLYQKNELTLLGLLKTLHEGDTQKNRAAAQQQEKHGILQTA